MTAENYMYPLKGKRKIKRVNILHRSEIFYSLSTIINGALKLFLKLEERGN